MTPSRIYWGVFLALALALTGTVYSVSQQDPEIAAPLAYANVLGDTGIVAGAEDVTTIEVPIAFLFGDNQRLFIETVPLGTSVLDLTTQTLFDEGIAIELQTSEFGTLVNSIDGYTNGDESRYWTYKVNGEFSDVGAGEYLLNGGEAVEWSYEAL